MADTYRIEVRFDITGSLEEVRRAAAEAAAAVGGEVTAIFDENWDEVA